MVNVILHFSFSKINHLTLFIITQDAMDIADPSSMHDQCIPSCS